MCHHELGYVIRVKAYISFDEGDHSANAVGCPASSPVQGQIIFPENGWEDLVKAYSGTGISNSI